MSRRTKRWQQLAGALLSLSGCADGADEDTSFGRGGSLPAGDVSGSGAGGSFGDQGMGSGAGSGGAWAADAGVVPLPPEVERVVDLQLPQASEHYVFAANPKSGTVAVIDAKTLSIRTLETGDQPTYLRTLPDKDDAIVLNIGSDTATVIRSTETGDHTTDLSVVPGANAIGIAPSGKHAVVYFNSSYASAGNTSGSFQDVTVLAIGASPDADRSVSMTVGFRPRDLFFSSDGARAFVVTEDGISILELDEVSAKGSGIARLVSLGANLDQKTLDVAITPDGQYALARAGDSSVLHLVELGSGNLQSLDVTDAYQPLDAASGLDGGTPDPTPLEITDVDLLPAGNAVAVVVRSHSALVVLPIPQAFDAASAASTVHVDGELIGSVTVAPDAKHALLYTTAAERERMTIVDLSFATAPHTVALRKSVSAVVFTPDSKTALITHKKAEGDPLAPGVDPDAAIDRAFGYSLLRVPAGDVKLQVTQTSVGPIAMVPDGSYLFALFRDDGRGIKEVHRVDLASFLVGPILALESPPISIGTAPAAHKVFVNQDHVDGRMLFVDWMDPTQKQAVTGFELNSRITD